MLEERQGGQAKVQYVWSPVGTDTLVERDRDPNGSGTLSERLYAQQDANGDVTALVNTSGSVVERYVYDPYGQPTVLSASWVPQTGSAVGWVYLYQGGRYDPATGYYNFRNRDLSPTLGRWLQQDPLGFGAGDSNLYRVVGNNPASEIDPEGAWGSRPGEREIDKRLLGKKGQWQITPGGGGILGALFPPAAGPTTPVLLTVAPAPGLEGYPVDVHDAYGIVLDILISGIGPGQEGGEQRGYQIGAVAADKVFPITYYDLMEGIVEKKHGPGWHPVPVEFRLTGLKFAAPGFKPRKEVVRIPYSGNGQYGEYKTKHAVSLVHFFIEGYWVFRAEKDGQQSELYALSTDFKERTYAHVPYDEVFAAELQSLRAAHKGDASFVIGRPYDREWTFMSKEYFKGLPLRDLQAISGKLRVGDKERLMRDIKPENIFPCERVK